MRQKEKGRVCHKHTRISLSNHALYERGEIKSKKRDRETEKERQRDEEGKLHNN